MSQYYDAVARYYDAEHDDKVDDLQLYSQLAVEYGEPILDVGCGTGRVLLQLAQEGYRVHGIDNNRSMLNRLDQKLAAFPHLQPLLSYDETDVFAYEPTTQFGLSLLTYNALMHFHEQDDQLKLLKLLRQWTRDDGLLVIDLPNAGDVFGTPDLDSLVVDRTFLDTETGDMVTIQSLSYLDRTTQLMRVEWFYDVVTADGNLRRMVVPHVLRYYFFAEMRLLLTLAGFSLEVVYGDMDLSPFEDGCERMIIFAKPKRNS